MNHTSTLPRSSMAPRNYGHSHGTMVKKSGVQATGEELRPLTGNGDHLHHVHHATNPSSDTLRRVRFEKGGTPESSNTPTSPLSMAAAATTTQKEVFNKLLHGNFSYEKRVFSELTLYLNCTSLLS